MSPWSAPTLIKPRQPGPVAAGPAPRWLRPAGARLAVLLVLFAAVSGIAGAVNATAESHPASALVAGVTVAVLALLLYSAVVRRVERRAVFELSPTVAYAELRTGTSLGLGLFALTILAIAMFGGYSPDWGSFGGAVTVLGLMTSVAVTEELLFRGVVFRLVEELAGTWGALVLSAVVFGALHLVNPDATVWGALAIAIEAGLMLGAAYAATRSLWLPIGLHLGWNLAAGGVFGATVSGSSDGPTGLLEATFSGPVALTGGDFGPEASVAALLVCAVPTVLFLRLAKQRGHLHARRQRPTR